MRHKESCGNGGQFGDDGGEIAVILRMNGVRAKSNGVQAESEDACPIPPRGWRPGVPPAGLP